MKTESAPARVERRHRSLAARVPALDGIRGIALLAVLGYHAAPATFRGGFLGVEVFFVLSGFLLVSLLLDEHQRTGAIDALAYAGRRLRRIAPALLVVLMAIAFAGRYIAPDDAHRLGKDILASLAGVTNWHLIADGSSYFAHAGRPPLVRHLWSIAVELQAYLVIPVVALFVARRSRKIAIGALTAGIGASALAMALLYRSPDPSRAYYGTDTRLGALLTGALVALLLNRREGERHLRPTMFLSALAAVSLVGLFVAAGERSRLLYPGGFLATQAATGILLVAATHRGAAAYVLERRPLRWLGLRSYGIYLWHWPLVVLLRPGLDVDWPRWTTATVCLAGALVLGAMSYRFVELPFLRGVSWARRPLPDQTRAGAVAWVAALIVIVALVARSAPVDPIAESISAGEKIVAAQEVATAAPKKHVAKPAKRSARTSAKTGSRPAALPAGKLPKASGPRPGTVKLAAIGDSVMLGAAPKLKSRLGKSAYIDASKSRHFGEGTLRVRELRKERRLGRVLVFHLGNNGPVKPEEVDALMHETKALQKVLLVTVRVNRDWQDGVNRTFKDAAKRHKTIKIVDWFATSQGHRDWFYSDGTHVNRTGADAFSKLIASSVPPPPKPTPKPKPTPEPTPTPLLPKLPA